MKSLQEFAEDLNERIRGGEQLFLVSQDKYSYGILKLFQVDSE